MKGAIVSQDTREPMLAHECPISGITVAQLRRVGFDVPGQLWERVAEANG